jgi:LPS sulfotransferase NodH
MSIKRAVREVIGNSKNALAVVSHKLLSCAGNDQYRRFIVLSRSRTGSNLLISLLNSHPHIHAEGEIFAKLRRRNCKEVLAKAFAKQPWYINAKGFKIFYYHPLDDRSCNIWDELQSLDDLYIIHLKRRNILRTLLSRKIARAQDVWAVSSDRQHSNLCKAQVSVSFTLDELNKGFKQTREWEEVGDKMFRNHPALSIDYEELVNDRTNTFRKVTEFLGVEYTQPKADLKKQNTKSMRETITNYDELKSAFFQTEWGIFFED